MTFLLSVIGFIAQSRFPSMGGKECYGMNLSDAELYRPKWYILGFTSCTSICWQGWYFYHQCVCSVLP